MGTRRRRWSSKQKLEIVLEGLEAGNVAEVCRQHGIYESQYYAWKKKLLKSADRVFEVEQKKDPEKEQLKRDKRRLEKTLVELSCELQLLKKNERTGYHGS